MVDIRTTYMGLPITTPFIVSSSSLTQTPEKIQQCAAAGAGAVVVKSLFEEEIEAAIQEDAGGTEHTEAEDYIRQLQTDAGITAYAHLIRRAKETVEIPVIASINAVTRNWWEQHVPSLERAGADAVELNISRLPRDYSQGEEDILTFYTETVRAVAQHVSIPIAVKVGPHFTNIPALIDSLSWAGASTVVLFNRFYQLDINLKDLTLTSGSPFSTSQDLALPLRWISLTYGRSKAELAISTGVHSGHDAVKGLLVGAQGIQVCSALYKNSVEYLQTMREDLTQWMEEHKFSTIQQFRGKLSQKRSDAPEEFERLQYIKALSGGR